MPVLTPERLEDFARNLLAAGGALPHEAETIATSLVDADLRGYDSHGVMRIPYYVQAIKDGEVVPGTKVTTVNEGPSRLTIDGQWAFGQMIMHEVQPRATEKARETGLCLTSILHAGHIGRLGEYCERAAADGLVTMLMVNSHGGAVRVAPPGGISPRLSTNPLAIGVPHGDTPISLDFSTSATAEGKVRVKKIAGVPAPEGWLLDNQGKPTTDPNTLYGTPPGSILPMGGSQSYKGFGLGLMIEILTGALSGGVVAGPTPYPRKGNCVFFLLIDPDRFGGADHFAAEVDKLIAYVRDCPRVDGCPEITLPGDPERKLLAKRRAEGHWVEEGNWQALVALGERLGVTPPAVGQVSNLP